MSKEFPEYFFFHSANLNDFRLLPRHFANESSFQVGDDKRPISPSHGVIFSAHDSNLK